MTAKGIFWGLISIICAAGTVQADDPPAFARMIIEGEYEDWSAVPVAFGDTTGDQGGSVADFDRVWIANDDDYIYVRFEIGTLTNLQTIVTPLRLYFDVDQSAATGYPVGDIGSDLVLLFPERHGAEQTASQFEAATMSHASLELVTGPTVAGTEYELRVRRDAVFPIRGTPLFSGSGFDILLEGQDGSGGPGDWAPDGPAAHSYTMTSGSLPPYEPIPLQRTHLRHVRLMSHNMLWDGLFKRPEPHTRILQAIQPDIICYQEVNSSAAAVQAQLDSILPLGDGVNWNAYKADDNVIASRWPLSKERSDTIPTTARGQAMALVDLPDAFYEVDLYVISAHFKCCGTMGSSEDQKRQQQADANTNWFRDLRQPSGSEDLNPNTPFLIAGDFNMVGGPQPLLTLLTGNIIDEVHYGPDSMPDWDGTPLFDALPLHNAGPAAYTWRSDGSSFGPGRMDFVLFTDSAVSIAKSYVLNTLDMSATDLAAYGLGQDDTAGASDHLPLVVDFDFCAQVILGDLDGDGMVTLSDFATFACCYGLTAALPGTCAARELTCSDLDGNGTVDLADFATLAINFGLQG